jgi:hypothetical protein
MKGPFGDNGGFFFPEFWYDFAIFFSWSVCREVAGTDEK